MRVQSICHALAAALIIVKPRTRIVTLYIYYRNDMIDVFKSLTCLCYMLWTCFIYKKHIFLTEMFWFGLVGYFYPKDWASQVPKGIITHYIKKSYKK